MINEERDHTGQQALCCWAATCSRPRNVKERLSEKTAVKGEGYEKCDRWSRERSSSDETMSRRRAC